VDNIKVNIIGGSISGLSAAISIREKSNKIDVIVHEKHKKIGYNHEGRRCGEAHSIEPEWNKWIPTGKSIFNEIKKAEIYIGNKKHVINRKPGTGYILNRQEFICQLARKAETLGATIQTNDKIKSVNDLDGDFIIDASGCPSSLKKELGFKHRSIGPSYQQTLEESDSFISDTLKIIFNKPFGYFWIFPRNPEIKEINVGLGYFGKSNYNLKKMLEDFKDEQKIEGKVNYVTGGLIPFGLQKPLDYNNILFVGDAGVGTFPLSGQGIYRALISGDVAGRCIVFDYPHRYSRIMSKYFTRRDLVSKTLLNFNYFLWKINPDLILGSLNSFMLYNRLEHI
jgi:digeranylgeranylglycerophospholipid reductase